MNVSELRIGNFIHYTSGQAIDEWSVVEELSLTDLHEVNDIRISSFSPIPLTEEWLVKFGFYESETNGEYWLPKLAFIKKNEYGFFVYKIRKGFTEISKFQYVHQLQNLYFALTGEELTIK